VQAIILRSLSLYGGFRPVVAIGQLFMPMAGGIFKRNADIIARPGLFNGSDSRCGTRRIGAGEGLGIGAFDLVCPSSGMFHDLVNNSAQRALLTSGGRYWLYLLKPSYLNCQLNVPKLCPERERLPQGNLSAAAELFLIPTMRGNTDG
jgi:hypothetical protein